MAPNLKGISARLGLNGTTRPAQHLWAESFSSSMASVISPSFIGEHPLMQKIYAIVERVASTDATVLISGESGTGKELVARAIHTLSSRAARPFVPVNCAAIPEELLESELFGHIRGAFTGATSSRAGMFQLADSGTILLDEVGEMSLSLQAKLLRVLQNKEIRPVGADLPLVVNVRVVASTNKDLVSEVEKGSFREDLFYRLRVIPIHLPPLRARRSDIPLLVRHLLEKNNRKYEVSVQLAAEAMVYLWEYDWPGNVRELENLIEQMVILSDGNHIGPEDLSPHVRSFISEKRFPQPMLSNGGISLQQAMEQFEYRLIDEALQRAKGNKTAAAQLLGLKRTTLVAKLRRKKNSPTFLSPVNLDEPLTEQTADHGPPSAVGRR
jgi:transcriptional regulator with GAF, ATPase, and Fis domain